MLRLGGNTRRQGPTMQQPTLELPRRLPGFTFFLGRTLWSWANEHMHTQAPPPPPKAPPHQQPTPPPVPPLVLVGRRTPLAWLIRCCCCCCLTRTHQSPRGAIQSRRAWPSWLAGKNYFLPLTKAKASNNSCPPGPWSGRPRRLQRETAIGAQSAPPVVQPFTRIMQHPHHDWPRVSDEES